jgi:hypothetical protein
MEKFNIIIARPTALKDQQGNPQIDLVGHRLDIVIELPCRPPITSFMDFDGETYRVIMYHFREGQQLDIIWLQPERVPYDYDLIINKAKDGGFEKVAKVVD